MTSDVAANGSKTWALFVAVAVVIVVITGAAVFGSLPHGTSPQPGAGVSPTTTEPVKGTNSTTESVNGFNSTATMSVNGLRLGLSLNQTTVRSGQTVAITVYERNTLQETNDVSASDQWPVNGLSVGPCGRLNLPMGIVVYRGNSSVLAVPGVQPLQLYQPGTYSCPMILSGISGYVFQPTSSEAQVIGSCSPNPCFTSNMSSTIDAKGYWGTTFLQSSFSDFAPGVYTVIAGDEWGQVTIAYFTVTSS